MSIQIQYIINKRYSLQNLSDEDFEILLPNLALELESKGVLYENYTDIEIEKDWKSLCKKPLDKTKTNISATCVGGMKIIRKHMKHFYDVSNYKGVSIRSLWKKEYLEKALRFNRKYHSTPYSSEIIRSLSFTNGLGKITMYRPLMARNIAHYFDAKSVLDVCVGWGGRLLGVKSLGNNVSYTGIEPCVKTFNGLCKICDELNINENTILVNNTAQVFLNELDKNVRYDMALTSPPYYNLEIYSDEETQSIQLQPLGKVEPNIQPLGKVEPNIQPSNLQPIKIDLAQPFLKVEVEVDYDLWLKQFLEPVIIGVINHVTYSCWSIKNFKTDKKYNLFDDVVRIHSENGWEMLDVTFTMANSKRPGSKTSESDKKTEETTYIFIQSTFGKG